jgi:hypothetical protein
METIIAAAPTAYSDPLPIGGGVTGSPKAAGLDESFAQRQILPIDLLPIRAHSACTLV